MAKSKVSFWETTVGKTVRAALYLAASAAISSLISAIAKDGTLFGVLTPIVNIVLVAGKNFIDRETPNL